ncbi:hypothetical protein J6590_052330 [Homalodisca vitripennis]|nr:hypothetical protein J6590_052330 [Homalodisca vitripennis]
MGNDNRGALSPDAQVRPASTRKSSRIAAFDLDCKITFLGSAVFSLARRSPLWEQHPTPDYPLLVISQLQALFHGLHCDVTIQHPTIRFSLYSLASIATIPSNIQPSASASLTSIPGVSFNTRLYAYPVSNKIRFLSSRNSIAEYHPTPDSTFIESSHIQSSSQHSLLYSYHPTSNIKQNPILVISYFHCRVTSNIRLYSYIVSTAIIAFPTISFPIVTQIQGFILNGL